MMETELSLDTSLSAVADANGVATTVPIGPSIYGEVWKVRRYSVSLTTGIGTCRIYRGYVDPTRQLDFTRQGEGDTSENDNLNLRNGDTIVAQWTGATVGAVGTIHFEGTRTVPGKRSY